MLELLRSLCRIFGSDMSATRQKKGLEFLDTMIRGGVPEELRIPLTYLIARCVPERDKEKINRVEAIRNKLAMRGAEELEVLSSPLPGAAGGATTSRPAPGVAEVYTAQQLANTVSCGREWGTFLCLTSQYSKARLILELGTCAGISGCFLMSGDNHPRLITVEGSAAMARIARTSLEQVSDRFELHNCLFDDALDRILPSLGQERLNIAWIDGHHEKEATIHYFGRIAPYLREGALVLFHDIRWSADMHEAWELLRQSKGFAHAIDLGESGLCIWVGGNTVSRTWSLNEYRSEGPAVLVQHGMHGRRKSDHAA